MNPKRLPKIIFLIFVLLSLYSTTKAQTCNGSPTGSVFPGNIMNYSPECAPVTASWYVVYSKVDDGGNPTKVSFVFVWDDGETETITYPDGGITYSAATKKYEITRTHEYPSTTTVCRYDPTVTLKVGTIVCTSTTQTQPVFTWDTDNEGSGELELSETSESVVAYQICEGASENVTFTDRSTFNCNIAASPDNPNTPNRWIQFLYGTETTNIPGVKVGATTVTNASGVPTILNGPVVTTTAPGLVTSNIIIDGTKTVGHVGDRFYITLRNWNYCNKYTDGATPVTTFGYIEIIDAPAAPIAASPTVCATGSQALSASSGGGTSGTFRWYSSTMGYLATGASYTPSPAVAAGTSKDFYVTETLGTTGCEGPATKVTLTVRAELATPSFTSGNTSACATTSGVTYTVTPATTTSTQYSWNTPATWSGAASTTASKTYTIGTSSGNVTATLQYNTPPACGVSIYRDVTVNPLPAAVISTTTATRCNGDDPNLRVRITAGSSSSNAYTATFTNGTTTYPYNGGTLASPSQFWGTPSFNRDYTPNLNLTAGIHTYTLVNVTNKTTGCSVTAPTNLSGSAVVTVRQPLSAPTFVLPNTNVCNNQQNIDYTLSLAPLSQTPGGATQYRWEETTDWLSWDGGTSSYDYETDNNERIDVNSNVVTTGTTAKTLRVAQRYTSLPDCQGPYTPLDVTVYSLPVATISAASTKVCPNTSPTLTVTITGGAPNYTVGYKIGTGATQYVTGPSPITITPAAITAATTYSLVSVTSAAPSSCSNTPLSSVTVTVHTPPVASISGTQTICSGSQAAVPITVTGTGPFNVVLNNGSGNIPFNNMYSGDIYYSPAITNPPTSTRTYTLVSVEMANSPSCPGTIHATNKTRTINIDKAPSVADAVEVIAPMCGKQDSILHATVPSPGTGVWSFISGPTTPTISAPSSINSPINSTLFGDYYVQWIVTNGSICPASRDTVLVSFGDNPTDADAGSDASSCMPTYSLHGNSPTVGTGTWTCISKPSVTDPIFSNSHLYNSTVTVAVVGAYTFRWTITSGACTPKTDEVVITFQPAPTANAGIDRIVCASIDTVKLYGAETNASARYWTVGSGTVVSGGSSLNLIYRPSISEKTAGSTTLTLNVTGTGACSSFTTSESMTLAIDKLPTINAGPDAVICGLNFTMAATKDIGTGTWSQYSGPDGATITDNSSPTTAISTTIHGLYKFVWSVTNSACTVTDTVLVRFCENPSTSLAGSIPDVCSATFPATATLNGKAHVYLDAPNDSSLSTQTWSVFSKPVGSTVTFTNASDPKTQVSVSHAGEYTFRWTETNGACSVYHDDVVNFYKSPSILFSPSSPASVCQGNTLALDGSPTAYNTAYIAIHDWTVSPAAVILSDNTIQNPTVKNTAAPDTYTLTYTITDSKGCVTTDNITLNVNALAVITDQPDNTTVCEAEDAVFSLTATGTSLSYQWQVNPGTGFTNISGETTPTLTLSDVATSLNNFKYRCRVSTFSGSCPKYSDEVTLTVNPLASISVQPGNKSVCENGNANFKLIASGSGLTYQWQRSTNGGTTWSSLPDGAVAGASVSGSTTDSLVLSNVQVSINASKYRCILTTTGGCTDTSNTVTLTVNAIPVISLHPLNTEVCENNDTLLTISATGTPRWQLFNGITFIDLTDNSTFLNTGTTTLTINDADNSLDGAIFRCMLTTTGSCQLPTNQAVLDVTPAPVLNAMTGDEICSTGSTYTIQASKGAEANNCANLEWTSSSGGTFVDKTTLLATYNINDDDRSDGDVTLILHANGNGSCMPTSKSMALHVTPAPTVTAGIDNDICETGTYDLASSGSSASEYSSLLWQYNSTTINFGGHATDINPTFDPLGATGNLTLTLTAYGNGSCAAKTDDMVLTVTVKPSVNAGSPASVCSKQPFDFHTNSVLPVASDYSSLEWTTTDGQGVFTDGDDLLPIYTPHATLDNSKTITITLTAYGNGHCANVTDNMKLTFKTLPITTGITGSSDFCINTSTQVYRADMPSPTVASTYVWGVTNPTDAPAISPFNNVAICDFNTTIPYSGKLYVVETNDGCPGDTVNIDVNSYKPPLVDAGSNTEFCSGGSYTLGGTPSATGGSGSFSYLWTPSTAPSSNTIANPVVAPPVTTQYTLFVNDLISGCTGSNDNVTVSVYPIPSAPSASDKTACEGGVIPDLEATGNNIRWYSDASCSAASLVYTGNPFNTGQTAADTYTYYATQTVDGCQSAATQVKLTINGVPAAPTASDVTACSDQTIPSLVATGSNIKWYSDFALTSLVYGNATYNTGKSLPGTYTYYVTQTVLNCQSNSKEVKLEIKSTPEAPATADVNACKGPTIPNLTATGLNIEWYSDMTLTTLKYAGSSYATGKTDPGSYIFYVTQTVDGCRSSSATTTLTIDPSPTILSVTPTPQSVCNSSDASITITATGTAPVSYSIDGGVTYTSSNIFSGLSHGTYSIRVKNAYSCVVSGGTQTILNGSAPAAPTVINGDKTYCEDQTFLPMIASDHEGGILKWYSDVALTDLLATGSTYTPLNTTGSSIYYVTETKDTCESAPATSTITVKALPAAPVSASQTICKGESTTMTATGTNVVWYTNPALTTNAHSGNSYFFDEPDAGSRPFYITQTVDGCRSLATNVTLTIIALPADPTGVNASICQGQPVPDLSVTGSDITWYNDASLTSIAYTGNPFATGKTNVGVYNYYATQKIDGCTSKSKNIKLTIKTTPAIPVADDVNACFGSTIPNLTVTGTNVRWYSDAALATTPVSASISFNTGKTVVGAYTYWVTQTVNGCTSAADDATLTIIAKPAPPTATSVTSCEGLPTPDLVATGEPGAIFNWYRDEFGSPFEISGNPFATGKTACDIYKYRVTQNVAGCESSPSGSISLTINPKPIHVNNDSLDETFCNMNNGKIIVTATPKTALPAELPLKYSKNNGVSYQTSKTFANLADGAYHIKVKNGYGCVDDGKIVTIEAGAPPPAPVASGSATYCDGETLTNLTATASLGGTLNWYSDASLFTNIGTGTTIAPDPTTGTKKYYVTETFGGCQGPATELTVTIGAIPAKPEVANATICAGSANPTLTSTGTHVNWYTDSPVSLTNLDATDTSKYTPTAAGSYYVTQTVDGCESPADTAVYTINTVPAIPDVTDQIGCLGTTIPDLTATGLNIKWYNNSTLSSLAHNGSTFATGKTALGTYTYYVTQTSTDGCQSLAGEVTLTINSVLLAPTSSDKSECTTVSSHNLTAKGAASATFTWYDDAALTSVAGSGKTLITGETAVGTYPYWVTQTLGGCQSPATAVNLNILATPAPPVVSNIDSCEGSTVSNLTAVGSNIKWYNSATLKHTGSPWSTAPTAAGTYTYNVTQTVSGCESDSAIQTLTIYHLPSITKIDSTDEKYCNTKDGTIIINATDVNPITFSIDNGVTYQASNLFDSLVSGSYIVKVMNERGCTTPGENVTIKPGSPPPAPVVTPDTKYCIGDSPSPVTATGVTNGTLKWYSDAALTTLIASGTSPLSFTPSIATVGSNNYYVYDSIGTCKGPSSVVKVTVNSLPAAITTGGADICADGSTAMVTFSFTGTAPFNYTYTDGLDSYTNTAAASPVNLTTGTDGIYEITALTDDNGCNATNMTGTAAVTVHALPTATITGTNQICNDGTATTPIKIALTGEAPFDLKYTVGIDTIRINPLNANPYIFSTSTAGTYTAVALTDNNGCAATSFGAAATVTVKELPTGTLEGSDTLCNDGVTDAPVIVKLTGSAPWNVEIYRGTTPYSSFITSNPLTTLHTTLGGTYKIYSITDLYCTAADKGAKARIVRNALPVGTLTAADNICEGDSTALNFSLTAGKVPWIINYSRNNIITISDTAYSSTYIKYEKPVGSSASYKITSIKDGNGCYATGPFGYENITINNLPEIASVNADKTGACDVADGTITIVASNTPASTLTYSITDTNSFFTTNPFINLGVGIYPIFVKNEAGCIAKDFAEIYNGTTPDAPTVFEDKTYCQGDPLILTTPITATANPSNASLAPHTSTFKWVLAPSSPYDIDGNDNMIPMTTLGVTSYYGTEVLDFGGTICESRPTKVTINIKAKPLPPVITTNESVCEAYSYKSNPYLTSSGTKVNWYQTVYDPLNPVKLNSNSYQPLETAPDTFTYLTTQMVNGCTSDPSAPATFVIKPLPPEPTVAPNDACLGSAVQPMHATGDSINWYSDVLCKNYLDTGNYYTTGKTAVGNYIYFATQTVDGCESPSNSGTLSIKARSAMPQAKDITVCEGLAIQEFFATGLNLQWYDASKTPKAGATNYNFNHGYDENSQDSTIIFYVTQNANGCESELKKVTLTIKPKPADPVVLNLEYCQGLGTPLQIATGTEPGATITWYAGTTKAQESTATNYTAPVSNAGTYNYSVKQKVNGCESEKTPYSIKINSVPVISTPEITDETYCNKKDGTIKIIASEPMGYSLQYSINNGVNTFGSPQFNNLASGNYQVVVENGFCTTIGPMVTIAAGGPPPAPVVLKDTSYCYGSSLKQMRAFKTLASGSTLDWYNNIGLTGTPLSSSEEYTPANAPSNTATTREYFVTETTGGCQSASTKVTIKINPVPAKAIGTDTAICERIGTLSLTANGIHKVKWYSNSKLTSKIKEGLSYETSAATAGIYNYYITQTTDEGCTSAADVLTLTINAIPPSPTDTTIVTCSGDAVDPLYASGKNIKWYNNLALDSLVALGNTYNTGLSIPNTYTYVATQTIKGCESPGALMSLTINKTPDIPVAGNKEICKGSTIPALVADGENVKWYNTSFLLASGLSYTPVVANVADTFLYLATQTIDGCESAEDTATLVIYDVPKPPVSADVAACYLATVPSLKASGKNVKWYMDENLNYKIADDSLYNTGKTSKGIYSYYATQTVNGCESKSVKTTLTINSIPRFTRTSTLTHETYCGMQDGTITIYATGTGTLEYRIREIDAYAPGKDKFTGLKSGAYHISIRNSAGCEVYGDIDTIKAGGAPPAPKAGPEGEYCQGLKIDTIRATQLLTTSTITWYGNEEKTDTLSHALKFAPYDSLGIKAYYITEEINGCESPATQVSITVSKRPIAPLSKNIDVCENKLIPDFTATGKNVCWYSDNTLKVLVGNGNIFSAGISDTGRYDLYVTQLDSGCESPATHVTLTIRQAPILEVLAPVQNGCPPLPINFEATKTTYADTVRWYLDDKLTFQGNNYIDTLYNPSIFNKYVRVKTVATARYNNIVCSNDVSNNIKVFPKPNFEFVVAPDSVCSPAFVQFISKPGGKDYQWKFTEKDSDRTSSPSISYLYKNIDPSSDTTINIRLIATSDQYECTDTFYNKVVIFQSAKVGFDMDKEELCAPDNVIFTNTSKNAIRSYWKFGDGGKDSLINVTTFQHRYESQSLLWKANVELQIETDRGCINKKDSSISIKPEIIPDFAADTLGCSPHNVQFTNLTNGSVLSYNWLFGDGGHDDKKNTFHTFFNYGSIDSIYRTSLITTSKEGCIDTVFKSITVSPTLLANFELDTDQLCEPYILKINNLSSGACENCYLWKFGDNGTSNDDSTVIFHTYPEKDQQNTYNVSVLLWNNNNKCLDSLKRTVVVNPPLRAIFNLEDTVCSPYTTTFNDISTGSGTRYYTWDFGDGYLSSLIEPLHTFANNGLSEVTYKVSLSTRSEFGCKDDTSHTITLFPAPEANFSITPFMQFFPNATYSFKDLTNPGPWKYLWTFGDGRDTSVSGNIKHTYFHWGEKAKEYKLPITLITSNVNCADTAYDTLILFPPKPVARFDTMSDGCTPIVVNFVNQSQWAESYEWDFNDRDTSSAENPIHTFTADSVSQDYRVTLTVHAEGGSDSYSEILKVYPIPIADFDVEPKYIILPKNTIKCYNHTINGYTYLWDFGDGSYGPENSYSDPKHMYNPEDEEKTYTLSLIALSEYGCSDTLTKDSIVFIKTGGDVKYPTAFVPSSSGPNDGNVNNVQDPNSLFRPFVESVKEYHFEIYNRWGDLIFTTDNIDIGWNGYFRNDGKKCAQDVYIYKAWGKFTNGQTFIKAGDVTLLHQDKK